jgi:hypothetical protein
LGRFTKFDNDIIDEQIQEQLNLVVQSVVEVMQNNVESVILGGGFGKGEGSVKVVNDRVVPLKDFDLMVIVKKRPDKDTINNVYEKIYKKIGVENCESRLFRFSNFVADLSITTRKRIKAFPDIATYEIKVASQLLYGEDVRKDIPWEVKDIPIASGWRFLFEKLTGLIGHFPQESLAGKTINPDKRELLIYESYKTYMEIGTSLTLLMGCYMPSFTSRADAFKSNFAAKLPVLQEAIPYLPFAVKEATEFKLDPDYTKVTENPLDLWFRTRDDLIAVSKFYLSQYLGINITDFQQSESAILSGLANKYFEPVAAALCRNHLKTANKHIIGATNSSLQLFFNLKYILDFKKNKELPIKVLSSPFKGITVRLHSIAPQVILSMKRDGSIDPYYFESAKKSLHKLYPYEHIESFEGLRTAYLVGYRFLWAH